MRIVWSTISKYRIFEHSSGVLQEHAAAREPEFKHLCHQVGRFLDVQDFAHFVSPTLDMRALAAVLLTTVICHLKGKKIFLHSKACYSKLLHS